MPFGGVRHSFTLAPFAFIFIGYGIQALEKLLQRAKVSLQLRRLVIVALAGVALLTFVSSGTYLYTARKASMDLSALVQLAEHYNVKTIAAYEDTYDILTIMDYNQGGILREHNLQLKLFDQNPYYNSGVIPVGLGEIGDALVVAYRSALRFDLPQVEVTVLWEDFGPLSSVHSTVNQSIYPQNGFFVYLFTKR
jgi:hypothetical protein